MEAFNPSAESFPLTNGHALNGAPKPVQGDRENDRYVFIISGNDEKAVRSASTNLGVYLSSNESQLTPNHLKDLAYTLGQRRSRFPWVASTSAQNISELIQTLDSKQFKPSHSNKKPRLGFVFNGQGAQWHAMGRELISAYPVFRASVQEADQCIKEFGARWSLTGEPLHNIICLCLSVSSTILHYVGRRIAHVALVSSFTVFNLFRIPSAFIPVIYDNRTRGCEDLPAERVSRPAQAVKSPTARNSFLRF